MRVAGALAIIVLLLVHLCSPLVPTLPILRNQSDTSAINRLCLCCLVRFSCLFINTFRLVFHWFSSLDSICPYVHVLVLGRFPSSMCFSFFGHGLIQTQLPQQDFLFFVLGTSLIISSHWGNFST